MDSAWLERVLREANVLDRGHVISVTKRDTGAFNSQTARLQVTYSPEVPGIAPRRLVLKRPGVSKWSVNAAVAEAGFYELAQGLSDHPPVIPTCLAWSSQPDDPYLLLVDLSDTHEAPLSRDDIVGGTSTVPRADRIDQVVAALAQLHGYWWEHPALEGLDAAYWSDSGEGFENYRQRRFRSWMTVQSRDGRHLSEQARKLYPEVFDGLAGHWHHWLEPRVVEHRGLTLLHGDAYFSNFLCSLDNPADPAVLLDWQSPCWDIGALDLVNLCATFWSRDQRHHRQRELDVLRSYHAELCAAGVRGYSFEDLCLDYRLGLVYWLLVPVQDAHDGSNVDYWRPKMQNLLDAFADWNCEQLLTPRR